MPIAKLVEKLICRYVSIVKEGEKLTEIAIRKFTGMF